MPVTMSPTPRFVLTWDMFDEVPNIEPDHGQSMDADTKCKFDVAWNGDDVTVTVGPDSLRVRAGASKTADFVSLTRSTKSGFDQLVGGRVLGAGQGGRRCLARVALVDLCGVVAVHGVTVCAPRRSVSAPSAVFPDSRIPRQASLAETFQSLYLYGL